jgi:hypothetical protein
MSAAHSIISDSSLHASVRYAAARAEIEAQAKSRREKRAVKFYIIEQLGGKHKKGITRNGEQLSDFVVFNDGTKAKF